MEYAVRYPSRFDDDAPLIEAKGVEYRPVFYDEARLGQEVPDAIAQQGHFAKRSIVVLPQMTREQIDAAAERLARGGFRAVG